MDFRKGKKGKDTDYALYLLTRDLQKFTLIEEEQIEIINNSLKGKWTGIYALKNKPSAKQKDRNLWGWAIVIKDRMLPDDYVKNIVSKGLLKEDEEIIDGFIYCKNCKTARMCFLEEFKATCPLRM